MDIFAEKREIRDKTHPKYMESQRSEKDNKSRSDMGLGRKNSHNKVIPENKGADI